MIIMHIFLRVNHSNYEEVPQLFSLTYVLEPFAMFKLYKPLKLLNKQSVLLKKQNKTKFSSLCLVQSVKIITVYEFKLKMSRKCMFHISNGLIMNIRILMLI